MTQNSIKEAVGSLVSLREDLPLIDLMRPWLVITGLEFTDAVHLTCSELVAGLEKVRDRLGDSIDLLDEDQLQEAACRCIKKVTVYGDPMIDGDFAVRSGRTIEWDGSRWIYVSDPKLRLTESSQHYAAALEAVRAQMYP
jgi:hypothetical protein